MFLFIGSKLAGLAIGCQMHTADHILHVLLSLTKCRVLRIGGKGRAATIYSFRPTSRTLIVSLLNTGIVQTPLESRDRHAIRLSPLTRGIKQGSAWCGCWKLSGK